MCDLYLKIWQSCEPAGQFFIGLATLIVVMTVLLIIDNAVANIAKAIGERGKK